MATELIDYDAYDAVLHHLYKCTQMDNLLASNPVATGVCVRVEPGHFRVFPYEDAGLQPFEKGVRGLNAVVALKVRNAAIHASLSSVADDAAYIYIDSSTRIQILDTISQLPRADKEQCGAFIRDERVLVVWSFTLDSILPIFEDFEAKLVALIWSRRATLAPATYNNAQVTNSDGSSSSIAAFEPSKGGIAEEKTPAETRNVPPPKKGWTWPWTWKSTGRPKPGSEPVDLEKGFTRPSRPIRLFAPIYDGFGAGLAAFCIILGFSTVLQEYRLDGRVGRFGLIVTFPFLYCVALFFCLQLVGNIALAIGPVAQYYENSQYYSAIRPAPNDQVDQNLPHVTIQIPVYKEDLELVIAPSVFSVKRAMQSYARQGGSSAILINDDGLQLISEEDRKARIQFYADQNIGWVARPPHDNKEGGFKRAGRFKKASNMNYGLDLSLKVEKWIKVLAENGDPAAAIPDSEDGGTEKSLEEKALEMAIEEAYEETGRKFRPWAANAASIRIGEIILICDSDTIVPEDCFRDAARELAESPELAIIQHESDVMQVAFNFFENGIAHFTRRINKCISIGCANGEVAPFVGHNAFLRWSAIQDASFINEDGKRNMWSESNVSEDFDMSLRLQLKGYIIRWATYSEGGFKEGVSLTCDDELNRWEKYAYGCNELIFNPLVEWWRKGPITKQLRIFVWSGAPIHYKLSMMAYMFSYYGIACSAALSLLNYLMLGFEIGLDDYYLHSFEIWLACCAVFPVLGNVGFTLLQYRLGLRNFFSAAVENVTWVPFFFFFFGGLSIHLSVALLAHIFSYNITWGATKKEVERSNFFMEVPKILKRFRVVLILSFLTMIAMIILSTPIATPAWRIPGTDWPAIMPLSLVIGCHILFPIVLNPWLMIFSY